MRRLLSFGIPMLLSASLPMVAAVAPAASADPGGFPSNPPARAVFTLFPMVVVQTFHAVPVSGRWTWILSPDQYHYYSAGTCPYTP